MASFVVGALVVGALVVGALVVGAFVVGALVVGALVVGALGALVVGAKLGVFVGDIVPRHVTLFGSAHAPVLRQAGHIAPSVHDGLGSILQIPRFPTMLQMPDSAPVSRLPLKYLRIAA